jgi:hypothetical protein
VLVVDQFVVLDTDPGRAREAARGPLRFLSRVSGYRASQPVNRQPAYRALAGPCAMAGPCATRIHAVDGGPGRRMPDCSRAAPRRGNRCTAPQKVQRLLAVTDGMHLLPRMIADRTFQHLVGGQGITRVILDHQTIKRDAQNGNGPPGARARLANTHPLPPAHQHRTNAHLEMAPRPDGS